MRIGGWVVYKDQIGILFQRNVPELLDAESGKVKVDALGRPILQRHLDFHPVADDGKTMRTGIVEDVVHESRKLAGGHGGLRSATIEEIPQSRVPDGESYTVDGAAVSRVDFLRSLGYRAADDPLIVSPDDLSTLESLAGVARSHTLTEAVKKQ